MNASTVALVALTLVLLLWIGLSIARTASTRYLQSVAAAYEAHYQSFRDNEAGEIPPVQWDFTKGKLVPIPPDEIVLDSSPAISGRERSSDVQASQVQVHLVSKDAAPLVPFWVSGLAVGKKLAKISPLLFHGVFAGIAIALGMIVLKLRM